MPTSSISSSNAPYPSTRNVNSENIFYFPPPSTPRSFETRDAFSLESHEKEPTQSSIADGNSVSPNQMLADFFQRKGSEPLSKVEAAGVISILASNQGYPRTLSSRHNTPTVKKFQESPSPWLTPTVLEKSVNGFQSQKKSSFRADLLLSTYIHSPLSNCEASEPSLKLSLSSSLDRITSLPLSRPSESLSENSQKKIFHNHTKSSHTTPNVNSSDSLISTVPASFIRSSSKLDFRNEASSNSRNTPVARTPIYTTTSQFQLASRSVSQIIKSSPSDQNQRTPAFVDKYKPLRSSALRQSTIRSPSSSPDCSHTPHSSSPPASQKMVEKTPANFTSSEAANITPTWAVPDFVDDHAYNLSIPSTRFTSISPSKPLYPSIKQLPVSGPTRDFIFALPEPFLNTASGGVSLDQEFFASAPEMSSKAIVSEIFTDHFNQTTTTASANDSNSKTGLIYERTSDISSANTLHLTPKKSTSQATEFSHFFNFPIAHITSPPKSLSFEKLEGYKQTFNF